MNIERSHSGLTPRHRVWCLMEDLSPVPNSDAFAFATQDLAEAIGDGSEIIVMDKPGLTLYWSSKTSRAYNWSGYDVSGEGKIREYRGLFADIKERSQDGNSFYTFVDGTLAAKLVDGATILIMDTPGMLLFWSSRMQRAYRWDEDFGLLSSRRRS